MNATGNIHVRFLAGQRGLRFQVDIRAATVRERPMFLRQCRPVAPLRSRL